MKIILIKNTKNLGKNGEIIDVKNGYARNYLIPVKIAVLATKKNIIRLSKEKPIPIKQNIDLNKINNIDNLTIIIPVSVDKNEKLYGSINSSNILKIIKHLNFKINKINISDNLFIKKTGKYEIILNFKNIDKIIKIFLIIVNNKQINDK